MTDEAMNDTMNNTTDDTTGDGSGRGRSVAAGLVGVVAVLGLVGGMLGFWTLRTATDSDRFEARVETLLEQEEISDALARRVVTEVTDAIGLRAAIEEALPEALAPAVDLLAAGVRSRVEDRVGELIRSPEVAGTIAAAAGRAHGLAIDVIEGDAAPDGVLIVDGEVRINLLPLTSRALISLQEIGLLRDATIPVLDRAGDPDTQRAELAAALDRELPPAFGTPLIFESESLDRAGDTIQLVRDVLVLAKRTVWFLLLGGLALAGLSIWMSKQRWRSAAFLVAGLFAFALVVRIVTGRARDRLPEAVESPGAKATVRELAAGLERSLNQTFTGYATIALLVLVVAAAIQFDVVGRMRNRDI